MIIQGKSSCIILDHFSVRSCWERRLWVWSREFHKCPFLILVLHANVNIITVVIYDTIRRYYCRRLKLIGFDDSTISSLKHSEYLIIGKWSTSAVEGYHYLGVVIVKCNCLNILKTSAKTNAPFIFSLILNEEHDSCLGCLACSRLE